MEPKAQERGGLSAWPGCPWAGAAVAIVIKHCSVVAPVVENYVLARRVRMGDSAA